MIFQVLLDHLRRTNTLTLLGRQEAKRGQKPEISPTLIHPSEVTSAQKPVQKGEKLLFTFSLYIKLHHSGSQIYCCSSFTKTSNFIELHKRSNHVVVELASQEEFNLIQLEQKGFTRHSQSFREDFIVSYLEFSRPVYGVVQAEVPIP